MDKKKLNQYRSLLKEIPKLKKDIQKLMHRLEEVPVVKGKVTKSDSCFPYTKKYVTVDMAEPKLATEIKKQITYKELRLNKAEQDKTEIEQFIASIQDSMNRQIFEMCFLEGIKQYEVGDIVGYSGGRISQIIKSYLED